MGAILKIEPIRTTTPTSTGDVDYTISGFGTVDAAIFIWTRAETEATNEDHLAIGIGCVSALSESTGQRCSATCGRDNVADSDAKRISVSDACVLVMQNTAGTPVFEVRGVLGSFITDGVRINYTAVASTDAWALEVILIGGAPNAYLGTINNTGGNQDITGPGFEPKIVLMSGTWTAITASNSVLNASSRSALTFGCAWNQGGGTVVQRSLNWGSSHAAAAGDPYERFADDASMLDIFQATVNGGVICNTFDSSGFTAAQYSSAGTHGWYLALGGFDNQVHLSTQISPTTVSDQVVTSPGFPPGFWLSALSNTNDLNTNLEDAEAGSLALGVARVGAASDRCMSATDQNAAATINANSYFENDAIALKNHTASATLREHATMQSFDTTGYTLDFDVVSAVELYRWDLVIERIKTATASLPRVDYASLQASASNTSNSATARLVTFDYASLAPSAVNSVQSGAPNISRVDYAALQATAIAGAQASANIASVEYDSLQGSAANTANSAIASIANVEYASIQVSALNTVNAAIAAIAFLEYSAFQGSAANTSNSATSNLATVEYAALQSSAVSGASAAASLATVEYRSLQASSETSTQSSTADIADVEYGSLQASAANSANASTANISNVEYGALQSSAVSGASASVNLAIVEYRPLQVSAANTAQDATSNIAGVEYASLQSSAENSADTATSNAASVEYASLQPSAVSGASASVNLVTLEYAALQPSAANTAQIASTSVASVEYASLAATAANTQNTATSNLSSVEYQALQSSAANTADSATSNLSIVEYRALQATAANTAGLEAGIALVEYISLKPTGQTGKSASSAIAIIEYVSLAPSAALVLESAISGIATFEYASLRASVGGKLATASLSTIEYRALGAYVRRFATDAPTWTIPSEREDWVIPSARETWIIPRA